MEGTTAHLHLSIETGSDPIAGSVRRPDEEPCRFSGWIELVEAIEHARRSEATNHAERAPRAG